MIARRCRAVPFVAITAALAFAGAAAASTARVTIVIGKGIDGVAIGQTKAQVMRRLGTYHCLCGRLIWNYVLDGYALPPVDDVQFARNGTVDQILAREGGPGDRLATSRGVGYGSTLAAVTHAYGSANCFRLPSVAHSMAPHAGRCAIVSRDGPNDVFTVFVAQYIVGPQAGRIDEVGIGVLGSASTEVITVSAAPARVQAGRMSATVTATVTSPSFYDFPLGVGIAGDRINLTSGIRGYRFGRVRDHGNGTYTATITGPKPAGALRITASDGSASGSLKVR